MAMQMSTGLVEFPITFDNGDKAVIHINPHDRQFLKQLLLLGEKVEARMKNVNLDKYKQVFNDGIKLDVDISDIKSVEQLSEDRLKSLGKKLIALTEIDQEYQDVVKAELNEVFKEDVSSVVFKYCQPLDNVVVEKDGEKVAMSYIQHFITEVMAELNRFNEKRTVAMKKHIGKYEE
jgi:hypothetical protein